MRLWVLLYLVGLGYKVTEKKDPVFPIYAKLYDSRALLKMQLPTLVFRKYESGGVLAEGGGSPRV